MDEYWAVDWPGLTEAQADRLVEIAAAELGIGGITVDPRYFFTSHIDDETARALASALESQGTPVNAEGLLEVLQDWLSKQS